MKTTPGPAKRRTKKVKFASLADVPATYRALCTEMWLPRPIRTRADHAAATEMADRLSVFEHLNAEQLDYLDTVSHFLEEREGRVKTDLPPLTLLAGLLKENHLTGADLSRLLGGSRMLGPMILRGERRITADHARTLAAHFKLSVEAFL